MRFTITLILLLFALPAWAVDTVQIDRNDVTTSVPFTTAGIGAAPAGVPLTSLSQVSPATMTRFRAALASGAATVVFWGDSITENGDQVNYDTDSYATLMQKALTEAFPSVTFTFLNYGIGGATITDALNPAYVSAATSTAGVQFNRSWTPSGGYGTPWRQYVRDAAPDLVVFAFGTNITTEPAHATALSDFTTYLGTWTKQPSVVMVTQTKPADLGAWAGRLEAQRATANATRQWAKANGYGVMDVERNQDALLYGLDLVTAAPNKTTGMTGWTVTNGTLGTTTVANDTFTKATTGSNTAASVVNTTLTRDFLVYGVWSSITEIPRIEFRGGTSSYSQKYVVQFSGTTLTLYGPDASNNANAVLQTATGISLAGANSFSVEAIGPTIKIWINGTLRMTYTGYQTLERSSVSLGFASGTGGSTITGVYLINYQSAQYPVHLTYTDYYGTYINGDYSTRLPGGGNGVNHPTATAIRMTYLPEIRNVVIAAGGPSVLDKIVTVDTANNRIGINMSPARTLDINGGLGVTGSAVFSGSADITGQTYFRNNVSMLNKAANGWLAFATRNTAGTEAVVDLGNLGTVSLSKVAPPADGTTAVQITNAAGSTSIVKVDTTNGRVGVNMTPARTVDIAGTFGATGAAVFSNTLDVASTLYARGNIYTLNKAAGGFLAVATRNTTGSEVVLDLTNIGSVTAAGNASAKTFAATIPAETTYGATTTIDLSLGDSPSVTLTGNPTLAFSNPKAGQWHRLNLVQDATGSRTVTWPSTGLVCTWRNTVSNAAPTLLTGANKVDTIIIHTLSTTSAECWAGGNK